jgi:hypothetical protein
VGSFLKGALCSTVALVGWGPGQGARAGNMVVGPQGRLCGQTGKQGHQWRARVRRGGEAASRVSSQASTDSRRPGGPVVPKLRGHHRLLPGTFPGGEPCLSVRAAGWWAGASRG